MKTMWEIFADEVEETIEENHSDNNGASTPQSEEKKEDIATGVVFIPIEMLEPYPGHIFTPYTAEKLRELADDIAMNGINSPICVRPFGGKYQILSGHNRKEAARLAGLTDTPCFIKDCDDDTAALIVVNSNLNQRENLLPSEKARAYKIQVEMLKKRGKNFENFEDFSDDDKENRNQFTGGNLSDGKTNIYRYIRLCSLYEPLLDLVDNSILTLKVGAEISYLKQNEQEAVYEYFFVGKHGVPDINTAKLLRQRAAAAELTYDEIEKLLQKKKKPDVIKAYSVPSKEIQQYIPPGTSKKDAKATIVKALKFYAEYYEKINSQGG